MYNLEIQRREAPEEENNHSSEDNQETTEVLPLQVLTEAQNAETADKKDKCRICHVEYGSDADIKSHWIQCCRSCGWWTHASCNGIYYPLTEQGLKAMNKWCKG